MELLAQCAVCDFEWQFRPEVDRCPHGSAEGQPGEDLSGQGAAAAFSAVTGRFGLQLL